MMYTAQGILKNNLEEFTIEEFTSVSDVTTTDNRNKNIGKAMTSSNNHGKALPDKPYSTGEVDVSKCKEWAVNDKAHFYWVHMDKCYLYDSDTTNGYGKCNPNISRGDSCYKINYPDALREPDKISRIKVGVTGGGDDIKIKFNSSSNDCYNKVNNEYLPKMPTNKYGGNSCGSAWKDPTDNSKNFYFDDGDQYKKYLQCKLIEDNNVMACKKWPGRSSGSPENATQECVKWYNNTTTVDCNTRYDYRTTSNCSSTCGDGTLTKSNLKCMIGDLEVDDKYCEWKGLTRPAESVTESCNLKPCPVDCVVSEWSEWPNCSADCGGGTQTRTRSITTHANHEGQACPTNLQETRDCNTQICPVDCVMNDWSSWNNCSVECGGGMRSRQRTIKVHPKGTGQSCPANHSEQENCNEHPCPVNCEMNDWSEYSQCSNEKQCGEGTHTKTRSIKTNAAHGGTPCPTNLSETKKCDMKPCPIDCVVSDWSSWNNCPKCKKEGEDPEQHRTRSIITQSNYEGKECPTNLNESRKCSIDPCPKWVCMVGDKEAPGKCGDHPNTVNVPITETKEEEKEEKKVNDIDSKINNKVNELVASNENNDSFDVSKLVNEKNLLTSDLSELLGSIADSDSLTLDLLS